MILSAELRYTTVYISTMCLFSNYLTILLQAINKDLVSLLPFALLNPGLSQPRISYMFDIQSCLEYSN